MFVGFYLKTTRLSSTFPKPKVFHYTILQFDSSFECIFERKESFLKNLTRKLAAKGLRSLP